MKRSSWLGLLAACALLFLNTAQAATVVALGASNTFGKGVARGQAYPAQLEALLRAKGLNTHVVNAGINGDTTGGMLARLDRVVRKERASSSCSPAATTGASWRPTGRPRFRLASLQWESRSSCCPTACCAESRISRTGNI
jgi:hypothetical protein